MIQALRETLRETGGLFLRTATVLAALWRPLLALALIGWVGYWGSVLLGVTVAPIQPYLVVPVLAAGAVVQLTTIVWGLRLVAADLQLPRLIRDTAGVEPGAQPADRLVAVMGVTLLPFLAIYSAFGMVDRFVTDLMVVVTVRYGEGAVIGELDPTRTPAGIAAVVATVVLLFVLRRILELLQERTGATWPGIVGVFVEACLLFLLLLGGVRIFQNVQLWWDNRALAAWLGAPGAWLVTGWRALPEPVRGAGEFVATHLWPVVWEILTQPLAWLTLASLAFGSRVVGLADLWRSGAGTGPTAATRETGEEMAAATAQDRRPRSRGRLRAVVLEAQQVVFGNLDDLYLPTWQSLRLVLRAGTPFLGAFILAFTVVRFLDDALSRGVNDIIGPQQVQLWIAVMPFVELVPDVLMMSVQVALLGAAFTRMLERFAAPAPRGGPTLRRHATVQVATVGVLCLGLAGVWLVSDPGGPRDVYRRAAIGVPTAFMGSSVTIGAPRTGDVLALDERDPLLSVGAFVVVPVSLYRAGDGVQTVAASLVAGERSYQPWLSANAWVGTDPGFETTGDFVFEVDPADLPDLSIQVVPSEGMLRGKVVVLEADLGLAAGAGGRVSAAGQTRERVP